MTQFAAQYNISRAGRKLKIARTAVKRAEKDLEANQEKEVHRTDSNATRDIPIQNMPVIKSALTNENCSQRTR